MPTQEEIENAYDTAEQIFYSTRDPQLKWIVRHWCQEIALQQFSYYRRMVAIEKLTGFKL